MEAKTWALGEILKPERRYIIPTFQRSYEWTRDGQWELLFADLAATAERLHHRREYAKLTGTQPEEASVSPHFLGAVVCDTLPFPAGGVALRSVIDGQQRLTTIQLLLRGLLDVVQEVDEDGVLKGKAKSLTKMISNDEDSATTPEDEYKLWPRRDDRGLWPTVIADAIPTYAKDEHLYLQARQYFAEAARQWLEDTPEPARVERLRAMVDAVDTLFKLVVIDLDQNDDAQVIFEVLNGRQQALSASDLVKNLIFLRAEFAKAEHLEELYDRYWAGFDDKWWKKKVGTGHAQRYRRDVLLSVWLTATTAAEVSVGNLYGEVRAYLDQEKPKTEELLADLKGFATAYEEIYAVLPVADDVIRRAYDRLIELNNLTAIPVLAWMRTLSESILSAEDHRHAVQAIESFTVRRMIAGWTTRNYGATFVRVMKEARAAEPGGISQVIIQALASAGWPTDAELENAMSTNNFYALAQFRQRLVLGGIDQRMRADDPKQAPATVDYGKLQIEHVLPGKWAAHWPLPEDLDEMAALKAKEARDLAKNRIGNLTLVTQHFNGSVSNLGWAAKQPEFAKQSSIMLNVAVAAVEDWDEDAIDERARVLAAIAAKVWPSPPLPAADESEPGETEEDGDSGSEPLKPSSDEEAAATFTPRSGASSGVSPDATSYAASSVSVDRVDPHGVEVALRLHQRTNSDLSSGQPVTWWTQSWRTRLRPGGPNRRFYIHEGQPWSIPADLALDMMEEMESQGGLSDTYLFDPQGDRLSAIFRSSDPDADRQRILDQITMPSETWDEASWLVWEDRPDPADPTAQWRKCLLVDPGSGVATFRSTTTYQLYKQKKELRPGSTWLLDNSMPDLSVEQVNVMLEFLRGVLRR